MKLVKKSQTQEFKNSPVCTFREYPFGDTDINCDVVDIKGRYPDTGQVINQKCKELVYVVSGSGEVVVENKENLIEEGDMFLIKSGEKYFFSGNLKLVISCAPAWTPEQHKIVK